MNQSQNQNNNIPLKDKDMMFDAISSQKFMTDIYNTFANECSEPNIRNEMLNILQDEHQIQADIFTELQKRGWYATTPADQNQIQSTKQKFTNQQQQ